MVVLNICILILIFLITFNFKLVFRDFSSREKKFLNQLFFYHFAIAVAFHLYIEAFGGDATHYWEYPKTLTFNELVEILKTGSGSGPIFLFNYFPSKILNLAFLTGNMLYAALGYIGFVYLYRLSRELIGGEAVTSDFKVLGIPVLPYIWFLPNLHFWSSGIGKDSVLFFCIALFVYGLMKFSKRIPLLILAIVVSLAIRPHVTMFLIIGFGVGYVLDGNLKVYQKVLIIVVAVAGFASIFNYVLEFVQLDSLETSAIEEYASKKSASLNTAQAGSGVDTSGYPFLLKYFTFLYRPTFIDISGVFAIIAAIENFILLIVTLTLFNRSFSFSMAKANFIMKGIIFYFLLGSIAFSLILGNMGIMMRQKNMFIPLFLIFICVSKIQYLRHKLALKPLQE